MAFFLPPAPFECFEKKKLVIYIRLVKSNTRDERSRHRRTHQSFRVCKVNFTTLKVATTHVLTQPRKQVEGRELANYFVPHHLFRLPDFHGFSEHRGTLCGPVERRSAGRLFHRGIRTQATAASREHVSCSGGREPRMLDFGHFDFGQFDFGQFDFGQLAEIELAEVEIGRSRTDGVCSVSSFSLFFFSFALFLLFFTFFLFLLISLFILFLCCFCFRPQKPELNPKPRTLHSISDGPFRWTPPSGEPPSAGQPSAGQPSARQPSAGQPSARQPSTGQPSGPPKISLFFFPPPASKFVLLSLSWGPFVEFCWCF